MTWGLWTTDSAYTTNSSSVWSYWTTDWGIGTATTSQLFSNGSAWQNWTTASIAARSVPVDSGTTVTISDCWFFWNEADRTIRVRNGASEEVRQQRAEAVRKEVEEKEAADLKAIELLQDLITDEEFALYEKTGRLLVQGRQFDYLVQRDSGRVVRVEKGKVVDLCMHLDDYHNYSKHDNVIAMKLFLEGREEQFNQEANRCGERQPSVVEQELLRVVNQ